MSGYFDHFGEYHPDPGSEGSDRGSVFEPDSKLQGQGVLALQATMAAETGNIWRTPEYIHAVELLNLSTKGNIPRVVTVSMGPVAQGSGQGGIVPLPPNPPKSELVAVLEIGVGGLAYFAELDFVSGVQFSIAVNRLKLNALFRTLPVEGGETVAAPNTTYSVGATAAVGVLAHGRQPQRTMSYEDARSILGGTPALAPGDTRVFRIPNFSKSFKVSANPNNSQLRAQISGVQGVAVFYNMVAYPTVDLPLPNDSLWVFITNVGIADVTGVRLIFDLAL